jgi:cytolysin (calcineurin-like family phosphatase)
VDRIATWEDAEVAAQEYAELTSQLERLEEQFKEFAERRRAQVGKERVLGPVKIGFEKVAAQVKVPTEALPWMEKLWPEYIERRLAAKKPSLKSFLKKAAETIVAGFRDQGVIYTSSYERFYLRLTNARRDGEETTENCS